MARVDRFQVSELVQAMYDCSAPTGRWMGDVVHRLYDVVGFGEGCVSYRFNHSNGASMASETHVVDGPESWKKTPAAFLEASTPGFRRTMHTQTDALTAREIFDPELWGSLAPPAIADGVSLQCVSPAFDGAEGVQFFAASTLVVELADDRRLLFGHLMSHWAAANRLRQRLGPETDVSKAAQAIVDSDFKVVHAEGALEQRSSLERLRELARSADVARHKAIGPASGSGTGELSAWTALADGQWSLVDHFDSDGRRYLVVLENAPQTPDPRALSPREAAVTAYACLGYANKAIAYHLGIDNSSVSRALRKAMIKLSVESREALIATYSRFMDHDGDAIQ